MDYLKRYKNLNIAQKEAVDTIDGPLMVIAGPGTGKTELLSMRAANILQQTDVLPGNILCLTFTDSAANAMRERLTQIIGNDAYKVSIHTFHSFGMETINQNNQFFYSGAYFRPVDDLATREILRDVFSELEYDNPIASTMNGEYTHLGDAITVISELKKSGLADEELRLILDKNDEVIEKIEPKISDIFADRISKKTVLSLEGLIPQLDKLIQPIDIPAITPLARVMLDSLTRCLEEASLHPKVTPPITAWKAAWLKKDHTGKKNILKSSDNQKKLRALSYVYFKYLDTMRERELYDYDDMILDVVHGIETNPELKATLQEKYQYVMVDEFQDTNLAQMRILYNLTDNIVNEGRPNVMVVGDDDQAIFSFHGADIGNILHFKEAYRDVSVVTLRENYRSSSQILSFAREIILQGSVRLENELEGIDKTLNSNDKQSTAVVDLVETESVADERSVLATSIKQAIESGESPSQITVIARRHSELVALLPYFASENIMVNYERQDNVLENELIILLENISKLLIALQSSEHNQANVLLSETIGHPAWGYEAKDIWRLSLDAYKERKGWMEVMENSTTFSELWNWLIELSAKVNNYPLENILDIIVGKVTGEEGGFKSPIYDYYFSDKKLNDNPGEYVFFLEALRTIRAKLREYSPLAAPSLKTFISFMDLNRQLGNAIRSIRPQSVLQSSAINLMTAHKAKGLEFDRVYVINAVDSAWGERTRGRSRNIQYPENLPIATAGDNLDERLRLFFVASTRAKKHLCVSYSLGDESGRSTMLASFVAGTSLEPVVKRPESSPQEIATNEWYGHLLEMPASDMREILAPNLESFMLSASHLNAFIDLRHGGPQNFLINNLLRFPQATSEAIAFGNAFHKTLQKAHDHFIATRHKRPLEDTFSDFETFLNEQRLPKKEYDRSLQRGIKSLQTFFEQNQDKFLISQKTELDFKNQQVVIEGAKLTGRLDLVDINEAGKTISITDYKTGKSASSWKGSDDADKIKLHKYKQQLMFYKLLVEGSRDFAKYKINGEYLHFVEPDKSNQTIRLEADFTDADIERLKKLVVAVWSKIISLDLPDISQYPVTLAGILKFEDDLIDNR